MKKGSLLVLMFLVLTGCGANLSMNRAAIQDVSAGSELVDLYLYGRGSLADPVKLAIIDMASDDFKFHLLAPATQYEVVPGIAVSKAVSIAEEFVGGWGTCTASVLAHSISGNEGQTIGYEFRPLYSSPLRGTEDPLLTSYWIRDDGDVGVNVTVKDANFGSVHCTRG